MAKQKTIADESRTEPEEGERHTQRETQTEKEKGTRQRQERLKRARVLVM